MPGLPADTIQILIASDSHVGYAERDAIRGDDSWQSFHEVMSLAKEKDVDMVLLAGDLFHENKPSRKSMFNVTRSLRMACYGDKPCELEMLSDSSEVFQGVFDHVNYEDPDINVAIPVFSIHGNHDDPSGEGHLAALDLLQASGLVNYFGRTPESDNIQIKPILLQKGNTKLALYGMSNVRDERLFRTFRDGKVKFYQPGTQKQDWFNLMAVHQNHHAHTETGYLPENFLPDFLDLVVWGHEHECLIDPTYNPEMNFHVMQPGSSVATSLVPGEAVPKHVAVLSITGRDFKVDTIRLKTTRPFVMREVILSQEKEAMRLVKRANNRTELTRFLETIVHEMIEQANNEWEEAQGDEERDEDEKAPLPLIRLRVEYSAPEGGNFDCENPQRFSNRFVGKVANLNDVVQFYRKKAGVTRRAQEGADEPEEAVLASTALDQVKVEQLVRDFLAAQSLTILPQNSFGDAVGQFVDKDDKHAMEVFVKENLKKQHDSLMEMEHMDEDSIRDAMEEGKSHLEELFASGHLTKILKAKRKIKPKPDGWDSDLDGEWADKFEAIIHSDASEDENSEQEDSDATPQPAPKSKSKAKAGPKAPATKKATAPPKKPAPAKPSRGKKKVIESESEEEDEDVVMLDSDAEDESQSQLFVKPAPPSRGTKKAAAAPVKQAPPPGAAATRGGKQSQLNFSSQAASQINGKSRGKAQEISDDDIDDDDDDAFEPVTAARGLRGRR
ncbi:meiotic recombination [Lecanora helva]